MRAASDGRRGSGKGVLVTSRPADAQRKPLRVAIAGFGAVGRAVSERLHAGIAGLTLSAVSARDRERAQDRLRQMHMSVPVLPLAALAKVADVIVECAPAAVFEQVARPAVEYGRVLVPISVGALLEHWELVELAELRGARIVIPTGALLGLDAVQAAAEGDIESVRMVTRKPPGGLAGAPYLIEHGIELGDLQAPVRVFSGSAREGARCFPANVNVAAVLGIAGIGPDRTQLEIWADPAVSRNTHHIVVEADSARIELKIENVPSAENPRTGKIVALSVVATLRKLAATLCVGT